MAATFADIADALDIVKGVSARDLLSFDLAGSFADAAARPSFAGVRAVWSPTLGTAQPDARVLAECERAARALEAAGLTFVDHDDAIFSESPVRSWIMRASAGSWHTATRDPTPWEGRFLPAAVQTARFGERVTAQQIVEGDAGAHAANLRLAALWEHADVLITPALPAVAPKIGMASDFGPAWASEYTLPFNLVRAPAAVVRCGSVVDDGDTLPVAIQIAAPRGSDLRLMSVAAAAEAHFA